MNVPANVCGFGFVLCVVVGLAIFFSYGVGLMPAAVAIGLGCPTIYFVGVLVGAADARSGLRQGKEP